MEQSVGLISIVTALGFSADLPNWYVHWNEWHNSHYLQLLF